MPDRARNINCWANGPKETVPSFLCLRIENGILNRSYIKIAYWRFMARLCSVFLFEAAQLYFFPAEGGRPRIVNWAAHRDREKQSVWSVVVIGIPHVTWLTKFIIYFMHFILQLIIIERNDSNKSRQQSKIEFLYSQLDSVKGTWFTLMLKTSFSVNFKIKLVYTKKN